MLFCIASDEMKDVFIYYLTISISDLSMSSMVVTSFVAAL
ncbi:hypothetical protein AT5A_12522 [Agrobacterium tumefaciens 5A]|nr:hypothetical protein AT5A_12522 [Agrobacterium tumefaciens 5A]